jgi:hypothetical protein
MFGYLTYLQKSGEFGVAVGECHGQADHTHWNQIAKTELENYLEHYINNFLSNIYLLVSYDFSMMKKNLLKNFGQTILADKISEAIFHQQFPRREADLEKESSQILMK